MTTNIESIADLEGKQSVYSSYLEEAEMALAAAYFMEKNALNNGMFAQAEAVKMGILALKAEAAQMLKEVCQRLEQARVASEAAAKGD